MSKKEYGYLYFPASMLKDILERRQEALKEIELMKQSGYKPANDKSCCSIHPTIFISYIKEEKSDKDWIELIAFLAIRSMLGNKNKYFFTNHKLVVSRMLGFNSYTAFTQSYNTLSTEQKAMLAKLSRAKKNELCKQKMRRLLERLETKWNILVYAHYCKGYYVSIQGRTTYQELAAACENRREKNKIKDLKRKKLEARLSNRNTNLNDKRSDEF